jgi:hypothetical protein
LFSRVGGDQLSVMKSQEEILWARKFAYGYSILQQTRSLHSLVAPQMKEFRCSFPFVGF